VKERECKSLQKVASELGCQNLFVITWEYEGSEKYGEYLIEFIPLWKWLIYK
jgi:predicted AAA+ superfamily ATPase